MWNIIRFKLLLLISCVSLFVQATPSLFSPEFALATQPKLQQQVSEILAQLSRHQHIKGEFVQQRHLALLSQPLQSSGIFELSTASGLHWQQQQPFVSQLSLNKTRLSQQIAGGPIQEITAQQQPALFAFTSIFLGLFRGDEAALKQHFNLYFSGDANAWQLGLTPLSSPLDQGITSIQLQGRQHIEHFELVDISQDKLTIEFNQVTPFTPSEP